MVRGTLIIELFLLENRDKPLQPQGNYTTKSELAGRSYDLSNAAGVVRALEDIIAALGGEVQQ